MIGSDVLVFPETGPEALLAIKTAALYAERIQVFSTCDIDDPQLVKMFRAFLRRTERNPALLTAAGRLLKYWESAKSSQSDLRLLAKEGLLLTGETLLAGGLVQKAFGGDEFAAIMSEVAQQPQEVGSLLRFWASDPPCVLDLAALGVVLREWELPPGVQVEMPTDSALEQFEDGVGSPYWAIVIGLLHLLLANLVAAKGGVETLCWTEASQDALATVRDAYCRRSGSPKDPLQLRRSTRTRLVQGIFETELPMVADLPLQEILEIRSRRQHELQAFRVGVAELATEIDVSASPDEIRLQVADLVSARVSPAIRNLKLAISSARTDALKKIVQSWESVAKATVPYVLSRFAGAPLDVQAAIATLGALAAVAGPLIAASLERKQLVSASQWSIVLRVGKSESKVEVKA
jgi:hypothetical protein